MANERMLADPEAAVRRHESDKCDTQVLPRSMIKNAPYNPRKITEAALKKLRDNIKRVGLIEPPIWNRRTGNLVGGHQRLRAMDTINRSPNYDVTVVVVDMDEKTEKEQNIFLNNPTAQGEWDAESLEQLFKVDQLDPGNTGFSDGDVLSMFGIGAIDQNIEALERLGDKLRELRQVDKNIAESLMIDANNDVGYYCVVVFRSDEERAKFTDMLGVGNVQYVAGPKVVEAINHGQARPEAGSN